MSYDPFASWLQYLFHFKEELIYIRYMFQDKKAECEIKALIFEGERAF